MDLSFLPSICLCQKRWMSGWHQIVYLNLTKSDRSLEAQDIFQEETSFSKLLAPGVYFSEFNCHWMWCFHLAIMDISRLLSFQDSLRLVASPTFLEGDYFSHLLYTKAFSHLLSIRTFVQKKEFSALCKNMWFGGTGPRSEKLKGRRDKTCKISPKNPPFRNGMKATADQFAPFCPEGEAKGVNSKNWNLTWAGKKSHLEFRCMNSRVARNPQDFSSRKGLVGLFLFIFLELEPGKILAQLMYDT